MKNTTEESVDNIVQTPQLRYEKFVMDRLTSELSNYSIYYNPYSNLIFWVGNIQYYLMDDTIECGIKINIF
jgi:hypothetical protein